MLLVVIPVLCFVGLHRTEEVKLTVYHNKNFYGRAVIVKAEPPSNYTASLYGPYFNNEPKFNRIRFNETGFWDEPGFRGSMEPFTWYNLTINSLETNHSTITFMTDLAKPIGGVILNFTRNESSFVEVSLKPQFYEFVFGPPTGYNVEACVARDQAPCISYVCLESPCKLDKLQPGTNYSVKASIFNVDSFNRTLEERNYVKLYNVTTKGDPTAKSGSPWILVGGSLIALCGLSGYVVYGGYRTRRVPKERSGASDVPTHELAKL